jgi:hypothetical protein
MNIFEGFRRISKIFIGTIIIGMIIGAFFGGFHDYQGIFDITSFLLCIILWPLFFLILTIVIGYITRGFMGIPQGQDKKPE